MTPTVIFRDFEERDIDFIYRCKNDEKLNSMIVGQWHPFTYEEATEWVHGCMGEHETYKFWAIATNDEEKRIIGWVSISQIDYVNQTAFIHGVTIGDKRYVGIPWIESYLFVCDYVFEVLKFRRLGDQSILGYKSNVMADALFFTHEGTLRQVLLRGDKLYDIYCTSILQDEYIIHKREGDYEIENIMNRIAAYSSKRK